jgi:hypothetical protein
VRQQELFFRGRQVEAARRFLDGRTVAARLLGQPRHRSSQLLTGWQ